MQFFSELDGILASCFEVVYAVRVELVCVISFLAVWVLRWLLVLGSRRSLKGSGFTHAVPRKLAQSPPLSRKSTVVCGIATDVLRDHAQVCTQIVQLCRVQVQRALDMYQAAIEAGLDLWQIPVESRMELFTALVTCAIRAGRAEDALSLLRDLQKSGVGISPCLLFSVVKLCTSKQQFENCMVIYTYASQSLDLDTVDPTIWSCLLFCALETRAYTQCRVFFERLKARCAPSQKDYSNMIRLAAVQGDWQLARRMLSDMRTAGLDIDCIVHNTVLATCVAAKQLDEALLVLAETETAGGSVDVVTYNTLMKGCVAAGHIDRCFEFFDSIRRQGMEPSQVTYGILLDGCINENMLDRATDIFDGMVSAGCKMNTILCTTLIKGLVRSGEVDGAMRVYERMRSEEGTPPDLVTFSILIKANCDASRLGAALQLFDAMKAVRAKPDEVIFNNLLAGCANCADAQLGRRIYADMLAAGVAPSNATFSILIRLYAQCRLLEEAVEMLRTEPALHTVQPEPRIFLQLIQCCIRERHGKCAVEVYNMMVEHSMPPASVHGHVLALCAKLNMFETGAEILEAAAARHGRIDVHDANALVNSALRKRKLQHAQRCTSAMQRLGLATEAKPSAH